MESKVLHIFNPEHDLALAVGRGPYTPPKEIIELRGNLSLLPAKYAVNGDFILLPSEISLHEINRLPYFPLAVSKGLQFLTKDNLKDVSSEISRISPWGWDLPLLNYLRDCGLEPALLPSEQTVDKIRTLSHRRTSIPFRKLISNLLNEELINPAQELFSEHEVKEFLETCSPAYFKAPWSSSGRGIVVSDHISPKGLEEWTHGVIKKQGSVIAEPKWDRTFDFATEWDLDSGKAIFKGLSVFEVSSRGKYHKNIDASQEDLRKLIIKNAPEFSEKVLLAQKYALEELIAPDYQGPLGIDMFADSKGRINYCVEINLRLTMGYINISGAPSQWIKDLNNPVMESKNQLSDAL